MAITASLVKELREMTGAGMMECKKALVEADGELEKAVDLLRSKGQASAAKKSGRITAEGLVAAVVSADNKKALIIEVNCETDFVAREDKFIGFVEQTAKLALSNEVTDIETLKNLELTAGVSVEQSRLSLVTTIGENLTIRRVQLFQVDAGVLMSYVHGGASSAKIASIVAVSNDDKDLAKDLAMHVAAMKPECISESEIPDDVKAREKAVLIEQAQELHSGKPAEVIEKIISGKLNKFVKEITLLGQSFVKDADLSIENLLKSKNATVTKMIRFEVGEGIEKKQDNFVEDVMSQVNK